MLTSFVSRTHRVAETAGSESKLEGELNQVLKDLLASQQIAYDPIVNETLTASGYISHMSSSRPDSLFGHVVLEYKKPGTLSKPINIKNAQKQVETEYLDALTGGHKQDAAQCERWAGIIWDGFKISFCHSDGIDWKWSTARDVSEGTLLSLIQTYRGLNREPLTASRLSKNFGKDTRLASDTIRTMCELLTHPQHRTNLLFTEWKRLFEQVSTYNLSQLPSLQKWARRNGIVTKDASIILFGLHTYYSIIVKLLTSELLAATRPGLEHSLVDEIANASSAQQATGYFSRLENNEFYKDYRISNLLEGDFFSWYVEEKSTDLSNYLISIARRMRNFEPATAKLKPSAVKDLLKEFYSSLVDEDIRHDLGEYYTPDWLVNYVLDQLGYTGDVTKVAIDPSCGSGTYLVECIARVRKYCDENSYSPRDTLKTILHCVRGLDLNPLAVISARANYVLAIADLIFDLGEDVEIPVYLADAINVPVENSDGILEYTLDTNIEEVKLEIPISLVNNQVLGKILLKCEEYIKLNKSPKDFISYLRHNHEFSPLIDKIVSEKLTDFYTKIQDLNLRTPPWDGIWCRVVKNNFSPNGFKNKVDYIVGNVPWVRWSRLPSTYRARVKKFCDTYGLVSGSSYTGGIESDISTVLAFSAVDNWLKVGGKIGILITWTVFKSSSAKGFRIGKLPDGSGLRIDGIEDLTSIQPFPDAINETGIYYATKIKDAKDSVFTETNCKIWKPKKTYSRISPTLTLSDVLERIDIQAGKALPVAEFGSPLWTGIKSSHESVSFLKGNSDYLAKTHRGTVNDLARVYWVKVEKYSKENNRALIRTLTEEELPGARYVDPVNGAWIEADLLYPLLRGREVGRYGSVTNGWYQIIPNLHYRKYEDENEFSNKYPLAYSYFSRFGDLLKNRATYKRYSNTLPSYGIFCIGDYSFSKNKVVWLEQQTPSKFRASVITTLENQAIVPNRIIVPDHKLYYVSVETSEEAHYLCAFLNSRPVRAWLGGFLLGKQIATSIFSYMNVPIYNPQDANHQRMSKISIAAHAERLEQKNDGYLETEREDELEHLVNNIIQTERSNSMAKNEDDKKVTNEKPVSLFPLDFKEAVAAIMKVKPEAKEKKKRKPVKKKKTGK